MKCPVIVAVFLVVSTIAQAASAQICGDCSAADWYEGCDQHVKDLCCPDVCPPGHRVTFCGGGPPPACTTIASGCDQFSVIACCPGEPLVCACHVSTPEEKPDIHTPTGPIPISVASPSWGCHVGREGSGGIHLASVLTMLAVARRRRR